MPKIRVQLRQHVAASLWKQKRSAREPDVPITLRVQLIVCLSNPFVLLQLLEGFPHLMFECRMVTAFTDILIGHHHRVRIIIFPMEWNSHPSMPRARMTHVLHCTLKFFDRPCPRVSQHLLCRRQNMLAKLASPP